MLLAERTQAHVLKCTFSAALSSFQTSLCAPRDPSVWGGVSSPLLPYLTRPLPLPPSVLCPHCLSERPATHYSQTTPKSLELFVPHPFSQGHWPLPFCLLFLVLQPSHQSGLSGQLMGQTHLPTLNFSPCVSFSPPAAGRLESDAGQRVIAVMRPCITLTFNLVPGPPK